jgi:hypothetical protein
VNLSSQLESFKHGATLSSASRRGEGMRKFVPTGTPEAVDEAIRDTRDVGAGEDDEGSSLAGPSLADVLHIMARTIKRLADEAREEFFTVHLTQTIANGSTSSPGQPTIIAVNSPTCLLDTVVNNDPANSVTIALVDGDPGSQNLTPRFATLLGPHSQIVDLGIMFRSRIGIATITSSLAGAAPNVVLAGRYF